MAVLLYWITLLSVQWTGRGLYLHTTFLAPLYCIIIINHLILVHLYTRKLKSFIESYRYLRSFDMCRTWRCRGQAQYIHMTTHFRRRIFLICVHQISSYVLSHLLGLISMFTSLFMGWAHQNVTENIDSKTLQRRKDPYKYFVLSLNSFYKVCRIDVTLSLSRGFAEVFIVTILHYSVIVHVILKFNKIVHVSLWMYRLNGVKN